MFNSKLFKSFISCFIVIFVMGFNVVFVAAGQVSSVTKVKIGELYVEVPYPSDRITIVHEENATEFKAIIKDKNTGIILDVFGELKQTGRNGKSDKTVKTVYKDATKGPITCRLYADVEIISAGGPYAAINGVRATYWRPITSGTWHMENETSNYYSNSPTTIVVYGGASIVVETSKSVTGELSLNFLQQAGYSVTEGTGGVFYARDTIDRVEYTYSLF